MSKWEKVSLKTIVNNLDNKRIPLNSSQRKLKESKPLYPYIGANNIMGYIDEYIFDEKIICVAEDGGSWGFNQRCAVIYNEKVWVNNHAHVLTAKKNLVLEYLMYYLNHTDLNLYINGATRGKLTKSSLESIQIPLPPLPQQQKIANILDAADELRQNDKKLIAKYDALTQALFLDMFGDPVSNPKGWEKEEFGKHITVLTDYHANGSYETLNENVKLKNTADYALMVRTTDLEKNNFDKDVISISKEAYNYLEKTKVFGGEMIINKIGSAGKVYIMPYLNRPVSLGMNAFMLRFKNTLDSNFIYFLLKTKYGEREISKRVKGAVTKTIRKDAIREIPILLPPLSLQNQFSERAALIEEQKSIAKNNLEKSEALFNSLLQKAFKGEFV